MKILGHLKIDCECNTESYYNTVILKLDKRKALTRCKVREELLLVEGLVVQEKLMPTFQSYYVRLYRSTV